MFFIQLLYLALIKKTDETKSDYKSLNEALNTIIEVNKWVFPLHICLFILFH